MRGIAKKYLFPLYGVTAVAWLLFFISVFKLSGDFKFPEEQGLPAVLFELRNIALASAIICSIISVSLYNLTNEINERLSEYRERMLSLEKRLKKEETGV